MRVVLITRPELEDTNRLMRKAAGRRGLTMTAVVPGQAAGTEVSEKGPRLIYRAAVDWPARLFEKLLARPGDALLHDPHFPCDFPPITLAKAGLPMARAVYVPSRDPDKLAAQIDWLGGFPVVVKELGLEGGEGVSRHQDMECLSRRLGALGYDAMIEAFKPHFRAWRLTVLGDQVLAASAMAPGPGDFRSNGPKAHDLGPGNPPDGAEAIAIGAARALRQEFGGADIIEGPDGSLTLAEFNFPCYFAHQQTSCEVDIAGHTLEYLASKVS